MCLILDAVICNLSEFTCPIFVIYRSFDYLCTISLIIQLWIPMLYMNSLSRTHNMKEFIKKAIGFLKARKKPIAMLPTSKITPKQIDTLKENEIFVFGCRNSGRHFDGASNFALNHFGAIMGQREGRQGQSYAIPTIGGTIELKEIRESVQTFTQYATEHPELHFLVTPIGCGGGCRRPSEIAPMFHEAAKLPNVSLPQEFWDILNK